MLKKNDEFELLITDMGSEGEGIGHFDGMAFFVKGAVKGDRLIAGATKLKKTYGYARIVKMLEPSKDRVEPPCSIAGKCGGCQLQALSYEAQLHYKQEKVREDLIRLGGISKYCLDGQQGHAVFHDIIGAEHTLGYRNKGQFPVGIDKSGKVITGFYAGHTHTVIDTESCMIEHPITDALMRAVRMYIAENGITVYDEEMAAAGRKNAGLVRHVLTRVGFTTHEVMVCVIINGKKLPKSESLICHLQNEINDFNAANNSDYILRSLSFSTNTEVTNVIMGDSITTIYGEDHICDHIGDVCYRISPLSFFQVNPEQTVKLYSTVLEYAGLTGSEVVWDLYCGIGTISLFLAGKAKKVYGVEIVPPAIADARENAAMNGITNAEFFTGAAEEVLPQAYAKDPSMRADVIVVDPPRKGCDPALLECMAKLAPAKIVYVSCDPATLSRDIRILCELGYRLEEVQPVDMFPHSGHVETIALLSRETSRPAKDYVKVGIDAEEYYAIKNTEKE